MFLKFQNVTRRRRTHAGFSWEHKKKRSWECLEEDEDGRLKLPENRSRRRRKEKYRIEAGIQRGMLRNVVIALDMSTP